MADQRVTPFCDQACRACPPLDELALALALELREDVDVAGARAALDELALPAMPAGGLTPQGQGYALLDATAHLRPATRGGGLGAFALDRVLATGTGHPSMLAVVQAEVARRAGLAMTTAGFGGRLFVVHRRGGPVPVVLEPGATQLTAPADLPDTLHWRCSHQVAFTVLGAAAAEASACGDLRRASRALELRLALPVDDETRHQLDRDLRALRARFN
ncbi:transglutaminase family protein [Conexibacter sp. SYSU D00693]|uniref:transglutaminase family protein n=1 Tax=Conexibacter sp. SYSU D00693 TaxID=2812560 RepID=UPI00196B87BB|nr:transglutaminase family protein [Conexibacter sp. SYSU D00693]